jgi:ADP-ribose pyrophosphatase
MSPTRLVPPQIRLELVEDLSPHDDAGFLRLRRRRLRALYPDGSRSEPFIYDEVDRKALDAVVMAAHYADAEGARWVYLRSALRPPLVLRERNRSPVPELDPESSIWELPAGLVEAGETELAGVRRAAARELEEELGFQVAEAALVELGPSTFPAPGVIAERHFYFAVEVDPQQQRAPSLDGSALEHAGEVIAIRLAEALALCRDGEIVDAKTELALRRLQELAP